MKKRDGNDLYMQGGWDKASKSSMPKLKRKGASSLVMSDISPNLKSGAMAKPEMKKYGHAWEDVGSPKGMAPEQVVHPHQDSSYADASSTAVAVDRKPGSEMKIRNIADECPPAKAALAKRTKLSLLDQGPSVGPEQEEGEEVVQNPRKLHGG